MGLKKIRQKDICEGHCSGLINKEESSIRIGIDDECEMGTSDEGRIQIFVSQRQ